MPAQSEVQIQIERYCIHPLLAFLSKCVQVTNYPSDSNVCCCLSRAKIVLAYYTFGIHNCSYRSDISSYASSTRRCLPMSLNSSLYVTIPVWLSCFYSGYRTWYIVFASHHRDQSLVSYSLRAHNLLCLLDVELSNLKLDRLLPLAVFIDTCSYSFSPRT